MSKVSFYEATKCWTKELWAFINSVEVRIRLLLILLLGIFPGLFIGSLVSGHYWYSLMPVVGAFLVISTLQWLYMNRGENK